MIKAVLYKTTTQLRTIQSDTYSETVIIWRTVLRSTSANFIFFIFYFNTILYNHIHNAILAKAQITQK